MTEDRDRERDEIEQVIAEMRDIIDAHLHTRVVIRRWADELEAVLRRSRAVPPHDYVALLKEARRRVEASALYRRFISGTPLENDIAVWMADFASEQSGEPAESRAKERP